MDAEKIDNEMFQALDHVSGHWDENRAEVALDGFHQRRRRRAVTRTAGAVAAAILIAVWAWPSVDTALHSQPSSPTVVAGSTPAAPVSPASPASPFVLEHGGVTRFDDGSTATPREGSELAVAEVTDERVTMTLGAGSARFRVTPDRTREFQVDAGDVSVTVLGTVFDVERSGAEVFVKVERGRVKVAGPHGERILTAGDEGTFPAARSAALVEDVPSPEVKEAPPKRKRRVKKSSGWRELAERGKFDEASKLLRKKGTKVDDDVDSLLLAADTMRLSGRRSDALGYLDEVITRHKKDPRAPLAMFTRGRVLSKLGRPREAAQAFSRVQALRPKRSLAEDALAREVEAWHRAGVNDRARERANDYLEAYPRGHRAQAVKRYGGID